ncbi:MAG: hypothetical protein ACOC80_16760 [Petrotogales bacterium]
MSKDFLEREDNLEAEVQKIKLYAVRNKEGNWFRAKGYGGYGKTWTCDIKRARLYAKIAPARSQVTFFANKWPEYGIPDIVEFSIGEVKILDETERVKKKQKEKIEYEKKQKILRQEWQTKRAKEKLLKAQEELDRLGA